MSADIFLRMFECVADLIGGSDNLVEIFSFVAQLSRIRNVVRNGIASFYFIHTGQLNEVLQAFLSVLILDTVVESVESVPDLGFCVEIKVNHSLSS